jgi:hypothetical protein
MSWGAGLPTRARRGAGARGGASHPATTYQPPDRAPPGETVTLTAQWHDQVRHAGIAVETVDAFTGFPADGGTTFTVSEPWTFTFRRYTVL